MAQKFIGGRSKVSNVGGGGGKTPTIPRPVKPSPGRPAPPRPAPVPIKTRPVRPAAGIKKQP